MAARKTGLPGLFRPTGMSAPPLPPLRLARPPEQRGEGREARGEKHERTPGDAPEVPVVNAGGVEAPPAFPRDEGRGARGEQRRKHRKKPRETGPGCASRAGVDSAAAKAGGDGPRRRRRIVTEMLDRLLPHFEVRKLG